jgi:diguanylate cyclase (GGDEF)-like protein
MIEKLKSPITTIKRIYLIIILFVALTAFLIALIQMQSRASLIITYSLALIFVFFGIISWLIVSRIRSTESALSNSEENLRTILDVSPIAVRIATKRGRKVVFYNRSYSNLIKNTSALDDDPRKYYARPSDYDEILAELASGNSVLNRQIELNVHGTSSIWTLASYMPIHHLGEEAVLGWFLDISHIKDHEAELSRIAHFDGLTGIPNRLLLSDRMNQGIAQTSRENNMMAVCYLDLDGFKPINDTYGHAVGDLVLIEIAKRIENCIRGADTVARLGGDEFVVLLLGQEKGRESLATLERLLASISEPIIVKNKSITVSASIGVSIYPLDDEDPDTLLRHADQSMYFAKQSGKNRFHIYDPAVDRQARDQNEFLKSFRFGLEHQQLELYYQPKVNLLTKEMVGVEALIRWNHPQRKLLPPSEFLRLIENTELEIKVGEWVISSALSQMNEWHESGFNTEVSINISGYHLESYQFFSKLQHQLSNFPNALARNLQIEILETVALNDIAVVRETINSCRNLGISFALDDFGTGYSSLSYLNSLPFDTLKIDQSFVRDMLEDKGDRAIVQGIIALAKAFERQTIAEGIETESHYQMLIDLGCELGQGYGIAKPMPACEIINWMSTYGKH